MADNLFGFPSLCAVNGTVPPENPFYRPQAPDTTPFSYYPVERLVLWASLQPIFLSNLRTLLFLVQSVHKYQYWAERIII